MKVFPMRWKSPEALAGQVFVLSGIMNYTRGYEDGAQVLIMDDSLGPQAEGENGARKEGYRRVIQEFLDAMAMPAEKFTVTAYDVPGGFIRLDIKHEKIEEEKLEEKE